MENKKIEEFLQLSRLNDFIKEQRENEKLVKTLKIVLICIGAATVIFGIAYAIYRFINRYDDEYDLYDDLDNYYDDEEEEIEEEAEEEAEEADFAE